MAVKDYLKNFSKGAFVVCYIVKFKENNINIADYSELRKVIQWSKFGESSYHAYCELSKENLIKLICKELEIGEDEITVINVSEFSGMRFS
ncbi:MAG: hypothetical protein ACRCVJ_06650 [Clostridium sp.]|uniref:hypothetical protein n=1 Tax=Clostridium sp. TaxID=1506 RepID=UPI003F2B2C65